MNWVAMFPGQGSQEPGMGSELLDKYSDYLNEEFKNTLGWSISEIVQVEDKEEIKKTNIAQPYIFAISYCYGCLLYTSPSPRDKRQSRMPSSA